ncbi:FAD-dependent oxidoreductase [Aquimarina sp. MMG015]|uniref:flavin monoamine oxidase family protein n=1 Tax=Aquimarina sp. MMG015 TaxID=2822689 RepID=UPI001B39D442|nr:FAD-dependent oxidoreductase [Aquimarina sp. MMG015]MBQ4803382.1 FAD-dependent oxidoreductase [Aquimarina sp. MMG015]
MKSEVLIIGAGLTGLLLAYRLKKDGKSVKIIEARNRVGGRIHTLKSAKETPIEMGATWLSLQHQELLRLLKELELPVFEQYMQGITLFEPLSTAPPQQIQLPTNQQPSYRIQHGTIAIIHKLVDLLDQKELILHEKIEHVNYTNNSFKVTSSNNIYYPDKVVSTIPPSLLVNSIQFYPALSNKVIEIANKTHTWMGDSIKFGVSYETPFWKNSNYSGTVFSNVGPLTELYDHSNAENTHFSLKGFLQNGMAAYTKDERKSKVIHQLHKLFGEDALEYLSYEELVWKREPFTSLPSNDFIFPHQNNGHKIYQQGYYDDKFFIGGTETSPMHGGYMEGAILSAQSIYQKLSDK